MVIEGLRQRLLALAEEDQRYARAVYAASQRHAAHRGKFLFDIPRDEWLPEYFEAEATLGARLVAFVELLDAHGWPSESLAGEDGCRAAWMLAQHAGTVDAAVQVRCEKLLTMAVEADDAKPGQLAALRDRIELEAGRHQLYGTHLERHGTRWRAVRGLPDPHAVDGRRAKLGLPAWREYLANCLEGITDT